MFYIFPRALVLSSSAIDLFTTATPLALVCHPVNNGQLWRQRTSPPSSLPPFALVARRRLIYPSLGQVLRYTALISGVAYGLYRQSAISAQSKIAQIDREYKNKENLIQKAKAEYVKKTMPRESKTEGGEGECEFLLVGTSGFRGPGRG